MCVMLGGGEEGLIRASFLGGGKGGVGVIVSTFRIIIVTTIDFA